MADQVTSFPFDPRTHLASKGIRGLWRLLQGYRLRYLGGMLGLFVSTSARTYVYLLLQFFVDQVVGKRPVGWYALVGVPANRPLAHDLVHEELDRRYT